MTESYYPPPPPPPPKSSSKKLIAVIVIVVVVVAVVLGVYFLTRSGNNQQNPPTGTPTPTPTSTPSPTQSSSPTATPTPTPTGTFGVNILSSTNYIDDGGHFTVVGEVKNTLGTNVALVKIVATFYDSSNAVIGTSYDNIEIDILKPNQKCPFEVSSYSSEITPASYTLSVDYHVTTEPTFEGLTIVSHSGSTDSEGYYEIVGEVQNNGAYKAASIKVIGTYYDSAGKVIGTNYIYTDSEAINVGETTSFTLSSYPLKITPASYDLQVEGIRSYT